MRSIRSFLIAAAPVAAIVVGACSDATGSGRSAPLSLSISTKQAAAAALASVGPVTATTTANTLVITKAQVVMDEIELKSNTATACSGLESEDSGGASHDECEELALDPILVDLPIDGVSQLDVGALVPAGTYRELEFKIDAVETGEHKAAAAFLAAHSDFRNVSVRVEGTFNGQPFVFTSSEDAKFELEFNPPIDVGGTTSNVSVLIDVMKWFKNASGDFVNPADSANLSLINANIKSSFHAFEDDNHDGEDDHHNSGSGSNS